MTTEKMESSPEDSDQSTVYLTMYHGKYPGDGPDIGGAYWDEDEAEAIADEQSDSGRDRQYHGSYVKPLDIE